MITNNDAGCKHEIKYRIAMAKAAFNRTKTLFISKLNFYRSCAFNVLTIWDPIMCTSFLYMDLNHC